MEKDKMVNLNTKKRVRMQGGNSLYLSVKQRRHINRIIVFVRDACKEKGFATYKAISKGTKICENLVSRYCLIAAHIENPKLQYETGKIISKDGVKTYQKVTFKKGA